MTNNCIRTSKKNGCSVAGFWSSAKPEIHLAVDLF